jgi:O-antigen/teichoic acid export membrane protein
LTQTAAGISFALLGFGYMSLAYASVLAALVSAFASVLFRPKALPWMPRFTDMKRVTVFGGRVSATTLINEVHDGAGDLFVGRALGLETVGYFARANSFVTLYTRLVLRAAWPVSYSVFAQRYRSGGDVGAALRQFTGIVSGVAWPGLVFLALYADAAVLLLFGSQWGASVTPARFLLAAAFVLVPVSFCTGALTATGDAKMALKLAAVQLAMRVVSLLVGLQFGLIGAAIGIASGSLVASFIVAAVAARALAFAWREWIAAVAPSLMLALLTNIVPAALLASDALASLPAIGRLAAAGALAAIAFVVSAFATGHAIAGEIRRLTGKLGGRFAA